MRGTDIEALGDLAGDALAAGGSFIKEMHMEIAARPFGALGTSAEPVRAVHDAVSDVVYGGVRGALRAASRRGAAVLAMRAGDDGPALAATPAGSLALGALNGLWGHHLRDRGHPLALGMEIRRGGGEIELTPEGLASGFPDATSRIAVFIHGLCENDESWRHPPLGGDRGRPTYGERLQDELSYTPVQVRYNSGLHVSHNGRELARVLDALVNGWPTAVQEVALVGHSMGGLVARSACHYAEEDGRRWVAAVNHVFCLGTPHLGAPLEKGVHLLGWAAGRLPETRALRSMLDARSHGIKDMRFGALVEEDWHGHDPDEFLRDRCQEVPFLPDANYYFISAKLDDGPLGTLAGDLFVRTPSASGRGEGGGRVIPFEVDNGAELSGLNHFDLLNHPAVYEQIRAWIMRTQAGSPLPAAPALTG
ncbi:MAG: esterase/lipase family protein [Solirubrobacteraceae bacterium]